MRGVSPELALPLDRAATTPLAVQLAEGLRAAVTRGALRVGERVPSTRALADELGVSRTVTAAAYDQLVAEGWLGPRRGAGTYVLATAPHVRDLLSDSSEDHARSPEPVDLRPGSPCVAVLDRQAWRRAWRRAGDVEPAARPEPAGVPAYRDAVARLLLHHRGLAATPDDVLATSGTTDGFAELVAVLRTATGRPPRVAVEEPGYGRATALLRDAGAEPVGVPVDAEGLRVADVPAGVDAVYLTPAHQYPLGARLPVARRADLVARARAEGLLLVEDDYDGELRYDVAPLPLLAGLAPDVTVHLGTTSKILSPGLGAGWMVAPPAWRDAVLARRRATSVRPAPAGQQVVAALHADGALARHLARLRRELAARRTRVVDAVTGAGRTVRGDRAGAHLVVPLPDRATEDAVLRAAEDAGVLVSGLAEYHLGPGTVFGILVGWAGPGAAELDEALARLRRILAA
ncbi:GntR family transcriptional regulator/MocR family aminotransferase [Actinomycetospora succinea]|uniref:GntR family transcriptional regulator/MocR family aminotransferase n=1 Tax=Actinomycetospora succinea TaxID=663603 RepID=A0A4R6VY64_9PSEU|nr:PLP-dependent aminotransferase family protein [Actinomycetospora succinea]TDQ65515.1 GntR family transcriptional regulator/MocR family aminotransferase [Actinomycetospora succinea]